MNITPEILAELREAQAAVAAAEAAESVAHATGVYAVDWLQSGATRGAILRRNDLAGRHLAALLAEIQRLIDQVRIAEAQAAHDRSGIVEWAKQMEGQIVLDGLRRVRAESIAHNRAVRHALGLQRFKDFVHERLDAMHIKRYPDGPHSKQGCRIGDRLDLVEALVKRARCSKSSSDGGAQRCPDTDDPTWWNG